MCMTWAGECGVWIKLIGKSLYGQGGLKNVVCEQERLGSVMCG